MIFSGKHKAFLTKAFMFGLIVKIVGLFFFASFPSRELFIPFLDQAVTNLGENPWQLSPPHFFPYGGALFTILIVPKFIFYKLFGTAALGAGALGLFSLKFPLLVLDIIFLVVLMDFAPTRRDAIIKYYWLNPALFYITYVHGQLDIASMTFLILSIYFLLKNRLVSSGILMGLAAGSKFHVAICVPFFLTYIWNREYSPGAIRRIGKWGIVFLATFGICFLPVFLAKQEWHATIGSPEIGRLFAMKFPLTENVNLYLGMVIVLLVLGRLMISTRITELGLVFGCGALMASLVVSSHAAPGWYFWFLPFLSLLFAMYLNVPRVLFWSLQLFYFLTYIVSEIEFFRPFDSLIYSGLQAVLIANVASLWIMGLKGEVPVVNRASSFRIGLAGDSGSGKNFLTAIIQDIFCVKSTSVIEGDNYHKWERGHEQWSHLTHLNPQANHLFHLSGHVKTISRGRAISHTIYSHATGTFTEPVELKPSKTVIVQGLHTLYFKSTRDIFDVSIFLDPHPLLRKYWKIKRDVQSRGYPLEKVLAQLEKRKEDSEKYISPQAAHADLIISYCPKGDYTEAQAVAGEAPELVGKWIVLNDVDLSDFTDELNSHSGIVAKLSVNESYPERVELTVEGFLHKDMVESMALRFFSPLRHLTRGKSAPELHEGHEGITQLLLLSIVQKVMEPESI